MTSEANSIPVCARPEELFRCLEDLRAQIAQGTAPVDSPAILASISAGLHRLTDEHSGMAEELLGVYEQLGIVFEVTRRLPEIHTEEEVVARFVETLGTTFRGSRVRALRRPSDGAWSFSDASDPAPAWLSGLLEESLRLRRVDVRTIDDKGEGVVEAMVAPMFCGDKFVCSLALLRSDDTHPFRACDMLLVEALVTFCGDLVSNHRLVRELRETSVSMVRALVCAVDQKDEYTSNHSVRVGFYSTMLGRLVGLSPEDLQMLQWSALLHDVGKIGIRDDVLKKEGKLTPAEFEHIKEHPLRSCQVVREIPQLEKAVAGTLHHHEHYDGKGYPHGLAGENIPLQARIVQIGDVFDALTSNRSYRSAFGWERALSILEEESGTTVDPHLQKVFDRHIRSLIDDDESNWKKLVERADGFAASADSLSQFDAKEMP